MVSTEHRAARAHDLFRPSAQTLGRYLPSISSSAFRTHAILQDFHLADVGQEAYETLTARTEFNRSHVKVRYSVVAEKHTVQVMVR
jgi:hypothetical protein